MLCHCASIVDQAGRESESQNQRGPWPGMAVPMAVAVDQHAYSIAQVRLTLDFTSLIHFSLFASTRAR